MAYFITFEGGEGSGKSTQIGLTGEFLKSRGVPFLVTEEPGGTLLGKRIRDILLNRNTFDIAPMAELLLFQASRYQHVETIIRPALLEGKVVICDRYTDATIAYQGFGRGIPLEQIQSLNQLASSSLIPDRTFLFDMPVETGLARASQRMEQLQDQPREDRFEQEALAFHQRVRDGYLSLAQAEPERFTILDGTKGIDDLHQEIRCWLQRWLAG